MRSLTPPYCRLYQQVRTPPWTVFKIGPSYAPLQASKCVHEPQSYDMGSSGLHLPAQFEVRRVLMTRLHVPSALAYLFV